MGASETKSRALKGSAWTLIGYGGAQVIRLGSNLLLAHLLFPAAFGVMSLVTVVMQGLQMFSEVGIGPSVIQNRRGSEPDFYNTAWTIQVVRGVILWLAACALAWPAAEFFGRTDPLGKELLTILPVIGLTSVLGGFTSTAIYTLNRDLKIAQLTMLELVPQCISVAAMIVWALLYPSIWALVGGWMVYSVVRLPMSWWLEPSVRNRFRWDRSALGDLLHFGVWIFLGTIVAFLANSLDRVLLGRLLTLEELGIYSIALTFSRIGIEVATRLSNTVLFPILSRSQDDPPKLVAQSLHARGLILLAGGALVCSFAVLAPLFFQWLYDPRYAAAGSIARWLAIGVWASILLSSMERVPLALGHPRASFVANLVSTGGYLLAVPAYYWWGLPGFILGNTAGTVLAHFALLPWIPVKRNQMILQTLGYTAVFALYCGGTIVLLGWFSGRADKLWETGLAVISSALCCGVAGLIALQRVRSIKKAS